MNKEFRRGLLLHKTVSVWRQEKLYESLYLLLLPFALFFLNSLLAKLSF